MPPRSPLVAIVGPCTAGKSTLVRRLEAQGWRVRHVAQEHSYVPYMWQHITNPDVLVYLDVTIEQARQRRRIDWGAERLAAQAERLAHAREHADLYLLTDDLSADEVFERVEAYLRERYARPDADTEG
ncbi:MAG: GTPase domain-containing protein [Anaerolineae bacterium]|nr:GTPase domain-containing protein [Anaerolineae bacterium]